MKHSATSFDLPTGRQARAVWPLPEPAGPRVPGGTDRVPDDLTAARQKRAKGAGGSFTSRMEDRFRRRFDE